MVLRRAVFLAMFPAAIAAPLAALILRTALSGAAAGDFLASLFLSAAGFLVLAAIAVLVSLRKSVRSTRAVSWADAALITVLCLAVVASGILDTAFAPLGATLLAIATFWVVVWELVTETRNRIRGFVAGLDPSNLTPPPASQRGDVYVIPPSR